MTAASRPDAATLLARFRAIVGPQHALTGEQDTHRFRKGHRTGDGKVLALVQPGTLLEQWRVPQTRPGLPLPRA